MKTFILDIETGPRSDAREFVTPSKTLKDPAKIEADIMKKTEAGALKPKTGEVLAIGIREMSGVADDMSTVVALATKDHLLDTGTEAERLTKLWQMWELDWDASKWIGWNIGGFDIPFLVKRSWAQDVKVPFDVMIRRGDRYRPASKVTDLMAQHSCGVYGEYESLDSACRQYGYQMPEKDLTPATYHYRWYQENLEAGRAYLIEDLNKTEYMARRMGELYVPSEQKPEPTGNTE